jgi:glyoxylate/hydroxypyruvate reductase A
MQVLFHCPWTDAADWLERLRAQGPEFVFLRRDEVRAPDAIEAAVVWRPPPGLFAGLDRLRGICAMGAGVDALFAPGVDPPDVPIIRLVDPVMTERMATYVLAAVLYHQRELGRYRAEQAARAWRPGPAKDVGDLRVGVMGLGEMGRASAELLARVGYDVAGWARSTHEVPGIHCFAGVAELPAFLARCDVLL